MTISAEYNQTLIDLCLQTNGNLDTLVAVAQANKVVLASTFDAGQAFTTPGPATGPQVAKYYALNERNVVTGGVPVSDFLAVAGETSGGHKIPFPVTQPLANQYQPVLGQCLLDMCLQLNGNLDNLVAFAQQNQTVVSAVPAFPQYLRFDAVAQAESPVAERFRLNGTYVVTLNNDPGFSIIQTEFENTEYEGAEYA